ncbi:uncharacterized protein I303_100444 [Kwoniella dejecticola CBS 10117]|uniref:ditrans,polycis-polyprenyl diphosphate synthase [(2E,6E)-farnesyldiphosphate specific] n=1 Tax=Kwoniella dejecticola CBS 10117 TaxID=1296121 RepID=A0A1A6AEY9_9TREE|nr:uncharacterized protein I303_00443 [Kwoniella dejecticola CBS 10117]OBR88626.1 hypothetical protein I303_00443 [Kwoniella dejecticola CBS 10117]
MAHPLIRAALRVVSYPFFILLHLIFVLSSLVLRTYETFTLASSLYTNATSDTEDGTPPKHLAVILVPSNKYRKGERESLSESILRSVGWASRAGIGELSFWDGQGLIQSVLPSLLKQLQLNHNHQIHDDTRNLPPSPPSTPPNEPTQDSEDESNGVGTPPSPSPRREGKTSRDLVQKLESVGTEVRTVYIRSGLDRGEVDRNGYKGLKLHFLPPSSSEEVLVNLTRQYVERKKDVSEISVKSIDRDIRDQLHFTSDPDLLLIHHLSPSSTIQALLPRRPPELWGYPFWSLRITEIYQYPSPLPLLHHLNPLLHSLRSSSLPFLRKLGHAVSLPVKLDVNGVLDREEWDGAMRAWSKVEQRLGK